MKIKPGAHTRTLIVTGVLILVISIIVPVRVRGTVDHPVAEIESTWTHKKIKCDGVIKWSDWAGATPVPLRLGLMWGTEPPYYDAIAWVKNNHKTLFILFKISSPFGLVDTNDAAQIGYFWPTYDPDTLWPHSDWAYVNLKNITLDGYGWDDTRWLIDEDTKHGKNNVKGAGFYDGSNYWFEISKDIRGKDGLDWKLELGQTYGDLGIEGNGHMFLSLWDSSESRVHQMHIKLTMAEPN